MQIVQQGLGEFGILRAFGGEGVVAGLVGAGDAQAAGDAEARQGLVETEAAADDADGADDAHRVGQDAVCGAGKPVAAGGADLPDDGGDGDVVAGGAIADAAGDEIRLYRGAAGAFDVQHQVGALRGGAGAVDQRAVGGDVEGGAAGQDAVQHQDGDARLAPEQEFHGGKLGVAQTGHKAWRGGATWRAHPAICRRRRAGVTEMGFPCG